jgi:hypothetical protein
MARKTLFAAIRATGGLASLSRMFWAEFLGQIGIICTMHGPYQCHNIGFYLYRPVCLCCVV